MAKEPKTPAAETAPEETVVESRPEQPIAQPKKSVEAKREVELKYGQCIIAPVDNLENEILVTINDWNSVYGVGKNAGKFKLLAEKKS